MYTAGVEHMNRPDDRIRIHRNQSNHSMSSAFSGLGLHFLRVLKWKYWLGNFIQAKIRPLLTMLEKGFNSIVDGEPL